MLCLEQQKRQKAAIGLIGENLRRQQYRTHVGFGLFLFYFSHYLTVSKLYTHKIKVQKHLNLDGLHWKQFVYYNFVLCAAFFLNGIYT